jgi:hypothetical protein
VSKKKKKACTSSFNVKSCFVATILIKTLGACNKSSRVLDSRIKEQICVDEKQFGFRPGKGTTEAKGKKLHYSFVDLEKEFD